MVIQIQELRISLISVETNPALLANAPPGKAGWAFLGRPIPYAQAFDDMQSGRTAPTVRIPPWDKAESTSFWTYYSEGRLSTLKGATAWNLLIPFRRKNAPVPSASWFSGRFHCDGFFYPHGLACKITAVLTAPAATSFTLDQAVKAAFQARTDPFQIQWPGQPAAVAQTLDQIGQQYLGDMRALAFGPGAVGNHGAEPPFSVVTIVRGVGSDPDALPDRSLLQALWGLCTWNPDYGKVDPPDLATAALHIKRSAPSHVLYAQKRGRAVWFPTKFTDPKPKKPSLSCYHRNLSVNTLQIESLAGLIALTADQMRTNMRGVSWSQLAAVRNAAAVLGRAYGGKGTYASWSSRVQMVDRGLEDDLDYVRTNGGLSALDRTNPWKPPAPAPPQGAPASENPPAQPQAGAPAGSAQPHS